MDDRVLQALRIIADNDQVSFSGEDLRALLAAYDETAARVAQLEDAGRVLLSAAEEEADIRPYASMTDIERHEFAAVLYGNAAPAGSD